MPARASAFPAPDPRRLRPPLCDRSSAAGNLVACSFFVFVFSQRGTGDGGGAGPRGGDHAETVLGAAGELLKPDRPSHRGRLPSGVGGASAVRRPRGGVLPGASHRGAHLLLGFGAVVRHQVRAGRSGGAQMPSVAVPARVRARRRAAPHDAGNRSAGAAGEGHPAPRGLEGALPRGAGLGVAHPDASQRRARQRSDVEACALLARLRFKLGSPREG
mmetsp:Transcript_4186/g.7832  ORF Transcript_4186/g.7832 Transcript_4186/m.7832 type:complete len:217 (+) Transcript_4186:117-767(+)